MPRLQCTSAPLLFCMLTWRRHRQRGSQTYYAYAVLSLLPVGGSGRGECVLTIMYSLLFLLLLFFPFRNAAVLLPLMCHAPRRREVELTIESREAAERASQVRGRGAHVFSSSRAPVLRHTITMAAASTAAATMQHDNFRCIRLPAQRKATKSRTQTNTHAPRGTGEWKTVTESHCKGKMFFPVNGSDKVTHRHTQLANRRRCPRNMASICPIFSLLNQLFAMCFPGQGN